MNVNNYFTPRMELAFMMSENVPEDDLRKIFRGELLLLEKEKNNQFGPITTQKIWKAAAKESLFMLRTTKVKEVHDRILSNFTDAEVQCMLDENKNMRRIISHGLKWVAVYSQHGEAVKNELSKKVEAMAENFISEIIKAAEQQKDISW